MKKLTTKQAFTLLAKEFEAYHVMGKRSNRWSGFTLDITHFGLCAGVDSLLMSGQLDNSQYLAMKRSIRLFNPSEFESGFYWPRSRAGAGWRALAAGLLAQEPETLADAET